MTGPAAFAALHTGPGPFLLPNAWDVASGVLLADAGFPAVGTTSLGVTAAAGLPDGAGAGRDLALALAAALLRLSSCVLIEAHDEWQDSDRRYLSEESMALLNPPAPTAIEPKTTIPDTTSSKEIAATA